MEIITIVDENDNVIGSKPRNETLTTDIYRGTSLWIEDGKGNVLLTKRALGKRNDPGKWMPAACAGTVAEGETYEENLIKEAQEELGLDLSNVRFELIRKRFNDGKHKYFSSKFKVILEIKPEELILDKNEVEEVKWFKKSELSKQVRENPDRFVSCMKDSLEGLI